MYCSWLLAIPPENRTVLVTCITFDAPPLLLTTGAVIGGWAGESFAPLVPGFWQRPEPESQTVPLAQSAGTHAGWPQLYPA